MVKQTSLLNIANDLLQEGKKLRIEAKGYSMYPTIKPGYTVYIEAHSNPEEVNCGDIIAWKHDENVILHRVVHTYESNNTIYLLTRGDGSLNYDQPVQYNQIIGKATLIESEKNSWMPSSKKSIPEWKYSYNKRLVWFIMKYRKLLKLIRNE